MPQGRLKPLTIRAPGLFGLNTQEQLGLLDPLFATVANNLVFDDNDRMAARKGWSKTTSSQIESGADITVLHMYERDKDTQILISVCNNKIWSGTSTLTEQTGTAGASNNWKFINFESQVIAVSQGRTPVFWDGGAGTDFANVTATTGSVPTGDDGVAAYGRLWILDADRLTLKVSGLQDKTKWATADDSAIVDLAEYFPAVDFAQAIAAFNNLIVVFGLHSILIFTGVHAPVTQLALNDVILGIGCIARDSIQDIGDDLIFLDSTGLRSLVRSIELKTQPLQDLTINVRNELLTDIDNTTKTLIKSVYNPDDGFYLITLPATTRHVEYYIDLRRKNPDNSARIFKWNSIELNCMAYDIVSNTLHVGKEGVVGKYDTYTDLDPTDSFSTTSYIAEYKSSWSDFKSEILKVLKRANLVTIGGSEYQVTFNWAFDFSDIEYTTSFVVPVSTQARYNISRYNTHRYSGTNTDINNNTIELTHAGQFAQVGWKAAIDGDAFAIQSISMFAKTGRLATSGDRW